MHEELQPWVGDRKIVTPDGSTYYFKNASLHREDGPAATYPNGTQVYWLDGCVHRPVSEGPAIIYPNGDEFYYEFGEGQKPYSIERKKLGKFHCVGGPAFVNDSTHTFMVEGIRHNIGGPAVIRTKQLHEVWFYFDVKHRRGGPAVFYSHPQGTIIPQQLYFELGSAYREDGPALIREGYLVHKVHGHKHNTQGPAEFSPERGVRYYLAGEEYSKLEHEALSGYI